MAAPKFSLQHDERMHLVLIDEHGELYRDVEPVRAFPLSDPRRSISLVDSDGREIVYIDSLDDLDTSMRELLEKELAQREFVPVIRRIVNTPPDTEPSTWQVETDRGITSFELESDDAIHRRDFQVSIVDSRGIRYLIPDTRRLDAHSRRVLDRYL